MSAEAGYSGYQPQDGENLTVSSSRPSVAKGEGASLGGKVVEADFGKVEDRQRCWATTPDKSTWYGTSDVEELLESGLFRCAHSDKIGYYLQKIIIATDELYNLPDMVCGDVISEIREFWMDETRNELEKRGYLYKRGILMFGEPGSGKTSTIQQLIKILIEDYDGIAMFATQPHILTGCLQMLRRIEKDRPIVVIMEDFETLTEHGQHENEWLAILDGESQIDNVVFLATTNYPEKLDKRFKDRPSRFDLVTEVPMPSAKARAAYIKIKEPDMAAEEIAEWVEKTENYSVAHLKEVIISVKVWKRTLQAALDRLNGMRKREASSEKTERQAKGKSGIGFTTETYESEDTPSPKTIKKWFAEWKDNGLIEHV